MSVSVSVFEKVVGGKGTLEDDDGLFGVDDMMMNKRVRRTLVTFCGFRCRWHLSDT